MSRKQPKRRAGRLAFTAIAGVFILAVACGVGFGVASAGPSDELAQSGAFGFDEATHTATSLAAAAEGDNALGAEASDAKHEMLASPTYRDIEAGCLMIDERAAAEEKRIATENAETLEKVAASKAKQGVESQPVKQADAKAESSSTAQPEDQAAGNFNNKAQESESGKSTTQTTNGSVSASNAKAGSSTGTQAASSEQPAATATSEDLDEYNLPTVDWSVGKKSFIAEWTKRIDAYLEGTPLEGYGNVFAESAWKNGIDPRWSPAISNTESGNGTHCFLPYNAWGWGNDSWPNWETAIRAHVDGLAAGYGYSLTFEAAQKYCPPNCVHWYNNTLGQMSLI